MLEQLLETPAFFLETKLFPFKDLKRFWEMKISKLIRFHINSWRFAFCSSITWQVSCVASVWKGGGAFSLEEGFIETWSCFPFFSPMYGRQLIWFISNVVTKHVDLRGCIFVEETTQSSCPYMGEKNGNPVIDLDRFLSKSDEADMIWEKLERYYSIPYYMIQFSKNRLFKHNSGNKNQVLIQCQKHLEWP